LINNEKGETQMQEVEIIFVKKNNRTFQIFADSGILKNKTNDLSLEGHVKMLIDSTLPGSDSIQVQNNLLLN